MQIDEQIVEKLIWPLWLCIDDGYKQTYKKDVWDHFENAIKSASYTGSMKMFLTNFQKRIPCDFQARFGKNMVSIIESGNDDEILETLRSESTYLVMKCRLKNQDRREAWEENHKGYEGYSLSETQEDILQ
jgi:hypothetical protein